MAITMSSYVSALLGGIASPPIVIADPDLVKYLILQLFVEAVLVIAFVVLGGIVLYEEWKHAVRRYGRWYGNGRGGIGSRTMMDKKRGGLNPPLRGSTPMVDAK
jgi:hypothetical protein